MVYMTTQQRTAVENYELYAPVLKEIRDGNYAVQRGESGHIDFLRISHPRGNFQVQTRHSDQLELAMRDKFRNSWGKEYIWIPKPWIVPVLVELAADQTRAALLFSSKLNKCCRCYKSLTDRRSRFFGIGPECEEFRPDIIEFVTLTKGFYEFSEEAAETGVEFNL